MLSSSVRMFSFFRLKLSPTWTYSVEGTIWRLFLSEGDSIVGESRNQDRKRVSFFCIDRNTGTERWHDLAMPEPWWTGIEAVHQDVVLLHEFIKPDMPEHLRIRAYDLLSGKFLWKEDQLAFWFAVDGKVYAYKTLFETRVAYALDIRSGHVVQEFAGDEPNLSALKKVSLEKESPHGLFPEVLDQHTDPEIVTIVRKLTNAVPAPGGIEYIRSRNYLVLNYYAPTKVSPRESSFFQNLLFIYDTVQNTRVFSDTLNRAVKTLSPDSFFVKDNFLYYIKEEKTLAAVRLWKS